MKKEVIDQLLKHTHQRGGGGGREGGREGEGGRDGERERERTQYPPNLQKIARA